MKVGNNLQNPTYPGVGRKMFDTEQDRLYEAELTQNQINTIFGKRRNSSRQRWRKSNCTR